MSEKAFSTSPPSESQALLKKKFAESIAAQSEQMDTLGQQLITGAGNSRPVCHHSEIGQR